MDEGADNQKMNYLKRTARIDPDVSVKDIASLKQAELDEMQIKIGLEQRNTHLLKRMVTILRDDIVKRWFAFTASLCACRKDGRRRLSITTSFVRASLSSMKMLWHHSIARDSRNTISMLRC